jgi:uncharacterized protein YecE (DUF72 family)
VSGTVPEEVPDTSAPRAATLAPTRPVNRRCDDGGMRGRFFVGTSGFAYDAWRHGVFYPEGLAKDAMLAHYASVLSSVEINYTFRRFPSERTLQTWYGQVPESFRFSLKANQRITHVRKLANTGGEVRAFLDRAAVLGDRLGPVLFQCPPTLPHDQALLEAFVASLPDGMAAAMEFRHPSWAAAWPALELHGIARCVAETDEHEVADAELSFRPFGYLRLRKTAYTDAELSHWAQRIRAGLAAGAHIYCYLKHEDSGTGPRWASRLAELVG